MDDQDTFIHLQGTGVRRSEFTAASFESALPEQERGMAPGADPAAPRWSRSSSWRSSPDGWEQVVAQYDRYSLLGWLAERGVSEQALWLLGPLLNLEGRFHFSLVEWFTHWYDDVFGDLEFIDAGSDSLPAAFAPSLLDDTRLGAEVRAIAQRRGRRARPLRATRSGTRPTVAADECIVTVPFVLLRHMEIERPRRREVVHDPERLLRPRPQDLHAVQPALVAGGRRDHRTA